MALPWLSIVDAVIGVTDVAMSRRSTGKKAAKDDPRGVAASPASGDPGTLEARLAGVVVAALKEAFDRDSRRLDLEREQAEAERQRTERALRLELLRQAGDREIGRLRLTAGIAVACWLGTLFFSARLLDGGVAARAILGSGWALLLAALACAFIGQAAISRTLARLDPDRHPAIRPGIASALAAGFIISGLALVGLAVLIA
jgi:hypothetical protein